MNSSLFEILKSTVASASARKVRTISKFAEDEIVIPDGPYRGSKFSLSRQPYVSVFYSEIDSGKWKRIFVTGPSQSGKTLCAFVIPIMYYLFEHGESVVVGVPDLVMVADKWNEDILPVISSSRYKELLPKSGSGSRGGETMTNINTIRFTNGATLKFMTGGSHDKGKAGFTARVLVVTETDGMDRRSDVSKESDKIRQLEARVRAYGENAVVIMECTVTDKNGRTWMEYEAGTRSRIYTRCPKCSEYVSLERSDFLGWQGKDDVISAKDSSFFCYSCGEAWSNEDRVAANKDLLLAHGDQTVENGIVVGDLPKTDTLGFRWSAVNNLFVSDSAIASDEWRSAYNSSDPIGAERMMRQFVWAIPIEEEAIAEMDVKEDDIAKRMHSTPKSVVPDGYDILTVGADVGKNNIHWTAVAWKKNAKSGVDMRDGDGTGVIIEYGVIPVNSHGIGVDQAVSSAIRQYAEMCAAGWKNSAGLTVKTSCAFVDAGWKTPIIFRSCMNTIVMPYFGRGTGQVEKHKYNNPSGIAGKVIFVGESFHVAIHDVHFAKFVEANVDYWKSWLHARIMTPMDVSGAVTLHRVPNKIEHMQFVRHLLAEREYRKGTKIVWVEDRPDNHWFDSTTAACVGSAYCGVKAVKVERFQQPQPQQQQRRIQQENENRSGSRFFRRLRRRD